MPTQHMLPHIQLMHVQTYTQTGPGQVQPNLTDTAHDDRSDGQTFPCEYLCVGLVIHSCLRGSCNESCPDGSVGQLLIFGPAVIS